MTEDEAKMKWCPFSRVMFYSPEVGQNPAINRPDSNVHCIGSACMAWRNFTLPAENGYCGLAGQS